LTPNHTATSGLTSFDAAERLSRTRVAGTVPLLPSVNSNDVRRAQKEYRVGGSGLGTPTTPAATPPAARSAPAWHGRRAGAWPGRLAGTAALAAAGLALFAAYLRQAQTAAIQSDGASNALQAWDLLHGNVLLRGWTMSDVSFYTTEIPQYLLVEAAHGLNPDVVHIAAAMSYTLMVLAAALLARGRANGREAMTRMLIAAGIMLAPSLGTGTVTLLSNPDHTGTQVPVLLIWLLLDRAPARWWVPVAVAVGLAWVQVGDPIVLYQGVLSLVAVCAFRVLRVARRRGPLTDCGYELWLAAGAIASAGAAWVALKAISRLGGFAVRPPKVALAPVHAAGSNLWVTVQSVGVLFGGDFSGSRTAGHLALGLIHLAGAALAVWAVGRALRRFGSQDLVVQVLAVTVIVLLAAYLLRGRPNVAGSTHEIAGLLPAGAVLAGRLLAAPLRRVRAGRPALALMLACYSGALVHNAVQPPPADPNAQVAAWLAGHHLSYGLGDYWNANAITLDSGRQVQVRAVSRVGDRLVPRPWESENSWYDAAQHDATFLVTPGPASACSPGTASGWRAVAQGVYGKPSGVYRVAGFMVVVWDKNLLRGLRAGPPHAPVQC
jgi:hypothetical protein